MSVAPSPNRDAAYRAGGKAGFGPDQIGKSKGKGKGKTSALAFQDPSAGLMFQASAAEKERERERQAKRKRAPDGPVCDQCHLRKPVARFAFNDHQFCSSDCVFSYRFDRGCVTMQWRLLLTTVICLVGASVVPAVLTEFSFAEIVIVAICVVNLLMLFSMRFLNEDDNIILYTHVGTTIVTDLALLGMLPLLVIDALNDEAMSWVVVGTTALHLFSCLFCIRNWLKLGALRSRDVVRDDRTPA